MVSSACDYFIWIWNKADVFHPHGQSHIQPVMGYLMEKRKKKRTACNSTHKLLRAEKFRVIFSLLPYIFGCENGLIWSLQIPDFQRVLFPPCSHTMALWRVLLHSTNSTSNIYLNLRTKMDEVGWGSDLLSPHLKSQQNYHRDEMIIIHYSNLIYNLNNRSRAHVLQKFNLDKNGPDLESLCFAIHGEVIHFTFVLFFQSNTGLDQPK